MAGVLATFLAAGEPGIDTSTGKLAASAKKFLAEEASWVRTGGSRVVWNKVTEKDNPKKSESLSGPACAPKPEGNKVRDSHEEALIKAVGYFCNADAATTVPVGPELNRTVEVVIDGPANAAHYKAQDWSNKRDIDDVYFFTLTTVDDCETPRNGYNLAKPLGDHTCNDILYRSWKDCEFLSFHHSQSLTDRFRPQRGSWWANPGGLSGLQCQHSVLVFAVKTDGSLRTVTEQSGRVVSGRIKLWDECFFGRRLLSCFLEELVAVLEN